MTICRFDLNTNQSVFPRTTQFHVCMSTDSEATVCIIQRSYIYTFVCSTYPHRYLSMFGLTARTRRPQDDEEFKLPKTSSTIIIISANLLLQVRLQLAKGRTWTSVLIGDTYIGFVLHHHIFHERLCQVPRRRFVIFWHSGRYSNHLFWARSPPNDEI